MKILPLLGLQDKIRSSCVLCWRRRRQWFNNSIVAWRPRRCARDRTPLEKNPRLFTPSQRPMAKRSVLKCMRFGGLTITQGSRKTFRDHSWRHGHSRPGRGTQQRLRCHLFSGFILRKPPESLMQAPSEEEVAHQLHVFESEVPTH